MRLAIIDLGTNSVRFDVHEIGEGKKKTLLHREKLMVRLGQGVFLTQKLDPTSFRRTYESFSRFSRIARELRVEKTIAIGTSALREAKDGDRLLQAIRKKTGIDVRVISGNEEARLIARGVLENEKRIKGSRVGLIDIGGGSTELSVCQGHELKSFISLPLGAARLQQVFLKKSPPSKDSIRALRQHIRNVFHSEKILSAWPAVSTLVGSSGTIRAIARLIRKGNSKKKIDRKALKALVDELSRKNDEELQQVPGLESRRADLILSGAILLDELVRLTGAKAVDVTEYSLRDGVLSEEVELLKKSEGSHLALHSNAIVEFAKRFGQDALHIEESMKAGDVLFHALHKKLGLSAEWKTLLRAAIALRRTGMQVAFRNYAKHSAYIVEHADISGISREDRSLVAALCRHHLDDGIELKAFDLGPYRKHLKKFVRALALLRVFEALDDAQVKRFKISRIDSKRSSVRIRYRVEPESEIGLMRIERMKKLFEKLIDKELEVVN